LRRNLFSAKLAKILKIQQQFLLNYKLFFQPDWNDYQEITIPETEIATGRIAIYMVNIGNYDTVLDPLVVSENCDYFLFTDNLNQQTKIWQTIIIDKSKFENDKLCAKYYKMFPHKVLNKKYDYSIYVDAKILIYSDIAILVRHCGLNPQSPETTFAAIRHNARSNILQEKARCIERGAIPAEIAERQLADYRAQGFPDNKGLVDTCCLVRKHSDNQLQKAMETWFAEYIKYPYRDQLSVMFSFWKSGFEGLKIIQSNVYNNQFIQQNRNR
jgi:hypothetical protein